jgi:phosphohistidine phosphatase
MRLYIVRHGIAESAHPDGDPYRELTDEGKKKVEGMAGFVKKKISPVVILTSPYVRALQTAEIFSTVLSLKPPVEKTDTLYPGDDPKSVLFELSSRREDEVLLTGHNPHMQELVRTLLGSAGDAIPLKKASITCIDLDGDPVHAAGILKWIITPGVIL